MTDVVVTAGSDVEVTGAGSPDSSVSPGDGLAVTADAGSDVVVTADAGAVVVEDGSAQIVVASEDASVVVGGDGGGGGGGGGGSGISDYIVSIKSGPHIGEWFLSNVRWDGSHFQRLDTSRTSFALNLKAEDNLPYESRTTGMVFWRALGGAGAPQQVDDSYGSPWGWQNVFIQTEYRDFVLGGFGIEVDGSGTFPYGRFVHTTYLGDQYTGVLTNIFVDFSGVDMPSAPSWFVGRKNDQYIVARAAPGAGVALTTLLSIDAAGNLNIAGSLLASAPSVAGTMSAPGINSLSTGKFWPAVTNEPGGNSTFYSSFTVNGCGNPQQSSSFFPQFITWGNVNSGTTGSPSYGYNTAAIRFRYYGAHLNFVLLGQPSSDFLVKINGAYLGATPVPVSNDGFTYFYNLVFPATDWWDVEFIVPGGLYWGGVWTRASDTIMPIVRKNRRIALVGDNYAYGSGATSLAATGYVRRLFDKLDWDNYIVDGASGTGILSDFAGAALKYRDRFAHDVYPFAPNIVIIQASLNDRATSQSPSALATEIAAIVSALNANLSSPTIFFTSEPTSFGVTATPTLAWTQNAAMKAAAISAGAHWIDLMERPLPAGYTPLTHTLAASISVGATSFAVNGAAPVVNGVYAFADGTRLLVRSVTGSSAPWTITTESTGVQTAQASGATLTQVGDCPWTGTGYQGHAANDGSCDTLVWTDQVQASQAGHAMIGDMIAEGVKAVLG